MNDSDNDAFRAGALIGILLVGILILATTIGVFIGAAFAEPALPLDSGGYICWDAYGNPLNQGVPECPDGWTGSPPANPLPIGICDVEPECQPPVVPTESETTVLSATNTGPPHYACNGASVTDLEGNPAISHTAPPGEINAALCIKAGNVAEHWYITQDGDYGTADVYGVSPCYRVEGLGTPTVTVTRIGGENNLCQAMSHVDVLNGTPPTSTPIPTPSPSFPPPSTSPTPTPTTTPLGPTPPATTPSTPTTSPTPTPSNPSLPPASLPPTGGALDGGSPLWPLMFFIGGMFMFGAYIASRLGRKD